VLITGTGRAGTTFLVELLTHLGLDTGFTTESLPLHTDPHARAGLEFDIREPHCPYIVKNPNFTHYAEEVLQREDITIQHVFIPMRQLYAAAESRRHVQATAHSRTAARRHNPQGVVNGGLVFTHEPSEQESVLLEQLYKLLLALSDKNIPVTFLRFPRLVQDCRFLFGKLSPILGPMSYTKFHKSFVKVARPEMVHSFEKRNGSSAAGP